jgi:hypothetical protein
MIETTLILTAALVAAAFWVVSQERLIKTITKQLEKTEQQLLYEPEPEPEPEPDRDALEAEVVFLKNVLMDVANGDAYVWVEDGELRAARTVIGETSIH